MRHPLQEQPQARRSAMLDEVLSGGFTVLPPVNTRRKKLG